MSENAKDSDHSKVFPIDWDKVLREDQPIKQLLVNPPPPTSDDIWLRTLERLNQKRTPPL